MLLNTSSVMLPEIIGCFRSFKHHTSYSGDPGTADQTMTCIQMAFTCPNSSPLRTQSHLEAFSAALMMFLMALLLAVPVMPRALNALWREFPANPLLPTLLGINLAFQPCARQSMTGCSYLVLCLSWASHALSSHGTVSSIIMMFFVLSEMQYNATVIPVALDLNAHSSVHLND